jgi:hypothetical protein
MGALVVTVGIWLTILGLRYLPGPVARKSRETWRRQDRTLTWTVIGALILRFWLCMPYAEEPLRLLSVMALCGASMILVLGTVAPPPLKPPQVYEHLVLPLALIPNFVVYPDAISPLVILYLLGFSGVVYLISLVLKNAFRGAYADRLASEAMSRLAGAQHALQALHGAARLTGGFGSSSLGGGGRFSRFSLGGFSRRNAVGVTLFTLSATLLRLLAGLCAFGVIAMRPDHQALIGQESCNAVRGLSTLGQPALNALDL